MIDFQKTKKKTSRLLLLLLPSNETRGNDELNVRGILQIPLSISKLNFLTNYHNLVGLEDYIRIA